MWAESENVTPNYADDNIENMQKICKVYMIPEIYAINA